MTIEEIKAKIPTLSEDQAAAVADFATTAVTAAKSDLTREIYTNLEKDIFETTGQTKPDGEKTYKFFRDQLSKGKKALTELEGSAKQIAELQSKYDALAAKAETGEGGNERIEHLSKELEAAKKRSQRLEEELTAKAKEWTTKLEEQAAQYESQRFSSTLERATSSVKFQEGISDYLRNLTIQDAIATVGKLKREWTDDGRLEFRGEDGLVLRDKETSKPLTADDLVKRHIAEAGLLAENPQRSGTGATGKEQKSSSTAGDFNILEARDQVTATRLLEDHLEAKGLQLGSSEYQAEFSRLHTEVIAPANLPVKATAA